MPLCVLILYVLIGLVFFFCVSECYVCYVSHVSHPMCSHWFVCSVCFMDSVPDVLYVSCFLFFGSSCFCVFYAFYVFSVGYVVCLLFLSLCVLIVSLCLICFVYFLLCVLYVLC